MGDIELLRRIQSGDHHAFKDLVVKYELPLIRAVYKYTKDRELSEDIVQDSFIKVFKSASKFQEKCSVKNWLYKITLNTMKNKLRSLKSYEPLKETMVDTNQPVIESTVLNYQLMRYLQMAIGLLPTKQQESLTLRVVQDLPFKQVAEQMNCHYDTAKANYRHAVIKVRNMMREVY